MSGMPVLLTVVTILATAFFFQGMTIDIAARSALLAQAGRTGDLQGLGTSPSVGGAININKSYDPLAADKQCPAESGTSVYRVSKPQNKPFKGEDGKMYQNLYGKPCQSDFVIAKCSAPNVCNGGMEGSTCFAEGKWTKCESTHPSVRKLAGFTGASADSATQVPGGSTAKSSEDINNTLKDLGKPQQGKTIELSAQAKQADTVTKNAFGSPSDTRVAPAATPQSSLDGQLKALGGQHGCRDCETSSTTVDTTRGGGSRPCV